MQIDPIPPGADLRPLWAIVTFMFVVIWVMIPLRITYNTVRSNHCMMTAFRPRQDGIAVIHAAEVVESSLGVSTVRRYVIDLSTFDFRFSLKTDLRDDWPEDSFYDLSRLVAILSRYEIGAEVPVRWVRAPLFSSEPILVEVDGIRDFGDCSPWAILGIGLLLTVFGGLTGIVIYILREVIARAQDAGLYGH